MARSPRVVIVGGGVAGLSAAYWLRRRGAEVTVLESNRIGSGASSSNAGWLCPAQAGPLPEPGLAADGLRSLMSRDSALYLAPGYVPQMLAWLVRFALRCNDRDHRRGVEALAVLSRRTFELIDQLAAEGVELELYRRGLLVAGRHPESVTKFLAGVQPLRNAGFSLPTRILNDVETREVEPTIDESVSSGLLIDEHWHIHPPSFMRALAGALERMEVRLEEGAEVSELVGNDGRIRQVRSSAGTYPADAVVLAAGAWSSQLGRQLGFNLPVRPGKGYSFELDLEVLPKRAVLLLEPHVGCSPLDGRLRVAGTLEFSGVNARLDYRRINAMWRGASSMIRGLGSAPLENVQSGMRPIAPDGLPIVDRAPGHHNVYIATAYSMLGMTLAAPAGSWLAELILTGRRPPELEPFRATRFSYRRRRPRAAARGRRWQTLSQGNKLR